MRQLLTATMLLLLALLPAATCQPRPRPTPPATGGTTPAPDGGAAGMAPTPAGGAGGAAGADAGPACGSSGSACAACANLARLGCPEGFQTHCATAIDQALFDLGINMRPGCLAAAQSKAEARSCTASVKCP